jgi:hypothetical protein
MTRRVSTTLALGLVAICAATVVVLARSPLTPAGTNSIPATNYVELTEKGKLSSCQPSGTIPQGTSAIRIAIEGARFSPATTVSVSTGSQLLREGHKIAGVSAPTVTVPVKSLEHEVRGAQICMTVGPADEPIRYYGTPNRSASAQARSLQQALLRIEYLRPDDKSWWSFASPIAHHLGLGRAPGGTWVAYLVLALMLAVIASASWLTFKELQ